MNILYLMKGKLVVFCALTASLLIPFAARAQKANKAKLTSYVRPHIGTGGHGHVFLGANVPFGAVQLGPNNISNGWDWCSGYHYSDTTITSFSHTHLSGTGIGDLGDIAVMPVTGNVPLQKGTKGQPQTGFYSTFSRLNEIARPGYYSVLLDRYNVKAELTATERCGFHKYTFPEGVTAKLIIDLLDGIGWDASKENFIEQVDKYTLVGHRFSSGWANNQKIYFKAQFSKPIESLQLYETGRLQTGTAFKGKAIKALVEFSLKGERKVLLKLGISPVSIENAALNVETEIPGWDFKKVTIDADTKWNDALQKVRVKTADNRRKEVFYTALYHAMIAPSVFNDVNKDYRGADKKIYRNAAFNNLTTFSLWDTYRAAHPLYTFLHPGKVSDMINTMLAIYKQQGKLPVWHLMANETNTMVGNPAVPVIADALLKGVDGFDKVLAIEAMKNSCILDERELRFVKKYGFIPCDSAVESVAKGLEYAIADWSLAQVMRSQGDLLQYNYWLKRGRAYQNYFDTRTRFMRAKLAKGAFRNTFNPFEAKHRENDYTEGNAWQYLWLVPQEPEGLISLLGGDKSFEKKLDSLFLVKGDLGEHASPDISGLIGQYAHGNEPSHHIAYLYAFSGSPHKIAPKVRYILDSLYTNKPDGLCGNEDVGQMSAWYVFSALGFYPVSPCAGQYVFGSPVFDKVEVNLDSGKKFVMRVNNNSGKNIYIRRIRLNGKPYTKSYLLHEDLIAGGTLEIDMSSSPDSDRGLSIEDRPYSQ